MAAFWRVLRCNTDFDSTSDEVDWAMIVTMSIMYVVQVAIHQIIHMIAMRNRFVPTTRSVHMPRVVPHAFMPIGAIRRILRRNRQHMFVEMPLMRVM